MKGYNPGLPSYAAPTNLISGPTRVIWGPLLIDLFPTSSQDAGLLVCALSTSSGWGGGTYYEDIVPFMIAGDVGRYFPDAGSIYQPGVPVMERINALDQMVAPQPGPLPWPPLTIVDAWWGAQYPIPDYLITAHGLPITGTDALISALTAQRDALQSVCDQTITLINQGYTIDEAAAVVALPAELAGSPYTRELVSTLPGVVRSIYHEQMGWFGGETIELASTLTPTAKAQTLADAFGLDNLIAAARQAELDAGDLAGAEKALYLAHAAYKAAPDDLTVRQIYAQALRKNAFMQTSAQVRNYYLSVALGLGE